MRRAPRNPAAGRAGTSARFACSSGQTKRKDRMQVPGLHNATKSRRWIRQLLAIVCYSSLKLFCTYDVYSGHESATLFGDTSADVPGDGKHRRPTTTGGAWRRPAHTVKVHEIRRVEQTHQL